MKTFVLEMFAKPGLSRRWLCNIIGFVSFNSYFTTNTGATAHDTLGSWTSKLQILLWTWCHKIKECEACRIGKVYQGSGVNEVMWWGKFIVKILCANLSTCDCCLALVGDAVLIRDALIVYENIYYIWKSITLGLLLSSSVGKKIKPITSIHHAKHMLKAMTKVSESIFLVDWDYLGETLGLMFRFVVSLASHFCFV